MTRHANRSSAESGAGIWKRPTAIVLLLLLGGALVLLVIDHWMHLIGVVPCMLLAVFPAIALIVYAYERRQVRRKLETLEREREPMAAPHMPLDCRDFASTVPDAQTASGYGSRGFLDTWSA